LTFPFTERLRWSITVPHSHALFYLLQLLFCPFPFCDSLVVFYIPTFLPLPAFPLPLGHLPWRWCSCAFDQHTYHCCTTCHLPCLGAIPCHVPYMAFMPLPYTFLPLPWAISFAHLEFCSSSRCLWSATVVLPAGWITCLPRLPCPPAPPLTTCHAT